MPRVLFALLVAFAAFAASAADQMEAPKEMVLLTVAGEINVTNRGPFDPDKDSLFQRLNINFDRAFAFDRPMLKRLKQGRVTAVTTELGKGAVFTGPLLKEVLAAVGAAPGRQLRGLSGARGYRDFGLDSGARCRRRAVGLGQQGPIWLINSRSPDDPPPNQSHRGHWVWAVFFMRVGE
ncbi:MAG TPA: hypothetical protein VFR71_03165 [Methyloceanibacter sp.]|nr:hypothetical protein [Methyloceanibacter sp.]